MNERFENRDLAGTLFHNVNLHKATFDDVNMEGVQIHNANLKDMTINDANIAGLTIYGMRIDQLIEAELDRRDPERTRLRMSDILDPKEVRRVLAHLDELRAEFYARLRATPPDVLNTHPGPDRWSALEHVRHLVFAEDMYLNRWLLRNEQPWYKLGFLPPFLEGNPAFADIGTEPTDDLETVLAAWDAIHTRMQAFVAEITPKTLKRDTSDLDFGQRCVGGVLQGMAKHDLAHIRMAETALADAAK
ncbi:MAG: DinB family protein [Anaerolineae bacterium]|nr:DinB family protein [Anaerolineae bacterium]